MKKKQHGRVGPHLYAPLVGRTGPTTCGSGEINAVGGVRPIQALETELYYCFLILLRTGPQIFSVPVYIRSLPLVRFFQSRPY
jgi:hypothetical protein